jgi:dienelactone hydrolase
MTEPLPVLPTPGRERAPDAGHLLSQRPEHPAEPRRFYHLGDTEWRDVDAAVDYARDHGATGIVLYGWSVGGTLTITALRRMPAADLGLVRAMVLDSGRRLDDNPGLPGREAPSAGVRHLGG